MVDVDRSRRQKSKFVWEEGDITIDDAPEDGWTLTYKEPTDQSINLVEDLRGLLLHLQQENPTRTEDLEGLLKEFLASVDWTSMPPGLKDELDELNLVPEGV
jgi:hypothetical protein